ncbi:MAG TPA: GNAT family N-acetyltransferase [Hyphomicrobiaceae bacterium]|nr:GNAT family N-acetyltransferase [Hyphomicrobiaceae bacterium]
MTVRVVPLTGEAMTRALPELARLRIEVFRAWPYLYDGTLDYEEQYLEKFSRADQAVIVAAFDGADVVGVATAAPLSGQNEEIKAPFVDAGFDIAKIFYFGESVLKPSYRGRGLGHAFFDHREAHARSFGKYTDSAFCGVVRESCHPLRPTDYMPLDAFWQKRGYEKVEGLLAWFSWQDIDQTDETEKPMQFWMRKL